MRNVRAIVLESFSHNVIEERKRCRRQQSSENAHAVFAGAGFYLTHDSKIAR
jgi:hypothetical protein